jgi:CMP-N-acetylneuraminic acid synthetase
MYWFVIPARKGSKGLPFKNRKLFSYTADTIPDNLREQVIVTSDDDEILRTSKEYGFKTLNRVPNLSNDTASPRDVLIDTAKIFNISSEDFIVLLYLVYPDRKWIDVQRAISFREEKQATSLLGRKEIQYTPYLMFFEEENGTGTKIINHDLCRRQDYRSCFSLSHYVGIFKVSELHLHDTNLWSRNTVFLPIESCVDIDTRENLEDFLSSENES